MENTRLNKSWPLLVVLLFSCTDITNYNLQVIKESQNIKWFHGLLSDGPRTLISNSETITLCTVDSMCGPFGTPFIIGSQKSQHVKSAGWWAWDTGPAEEVTQCQLLPKASREPYTLVFPHFSSCQFQKRQTSRAEIDVFVWLVQSAEIDRGWKWWK